MRHHRDCCPHRDLARGVGLFETPPHGIAAAARRPALPACAPPEPRRGTAPRPSRPGPALAGAGRSPSPHRPVAPAAPALNRPPVPPRPTGASGPVPLLERRAPTDQALGRAARPGRGGQQHRAVRRPMAGAAARRRGRDGGGARRPVQADIRIMNSGIRAPTRRRADVIRLVTYVVVAIHLSPPQPKSIRTST